MGEIVKKENRKWDKVQVCDGIKGYAGASGGGRGGPARPDRTPSVAALPAGASHATRDLFKESDPSWVLRRPPTMVYHHSLKPDLAGWHQRLTGSRKRENI